MRLQVTLVFLALALMCGVDAKPQQQPGFDSSESRDRGIQLYQQGDATAAIEALRRAVQKNKDDGDAWHYLGLSFLLKGDKDEARKAFAKAVTIRVNSLEAFYPVPDKQDPTTVRAKHVERYRAAVESLEKYLEVASNSSADRIYELETLRWYRDFYSGLVKDEEITSAKEVTTKLHILSKPPPNFSGTRAAGTASLRAVFSADGSVKHILVLRKVDPNFDQACIEAAKKIQFQPAIKDGHAVSMILLIEYGRHLY
jgi:tetratricopeptide (TPR) repeat protein